MIELIQFPPSPYCIVQRRILEFAGVRFKITNIPNGDRSLVWRVTRQRYYHVPVIRDGRTVIFETAEDTQVIAKYLDDRLRLGLFPRELEGVQSILWRYIEREIEDLTFRLNDIYWREFTPPGERLAFLRHKERKFGRGCLERWRLEGKSLLSGLQDRLLPLDEMLMGNPYLLGPRPHFVDFDLFGMLENFLYSGPYALPAVHRRLMDWHVRMGRVTCASFASETLRP